VKPAPYEQPFHNVCLGIHSGIQMMRQAVYMKSPARSHEKAVDLLLGVETLRDILDAIADDANSVLKTHLKQEDDADAITD